MTLQELYSFIRDGQRKSHHHIVDRLEFRPVQDIDGEIRRVLREPSDSEHVTEGHLLVGSEKERISVEEAVLRRSLINPTSHDVGVFCKCFLQHRTTFLDGPTRIDLVNSQRARDLQKKAPTTLQLLYVDDAKRSRVREVLFDAFGEYFVIDPTNLGHLRIRMSQSAPPLPEIERGIDERAVRFHGSAALIDSKSDGVKAFSGIICEIVAGDPNIVLIDEPEAFLHPSLSFKLGKQVALQIRGANKCVFASTHSESFLRGCIQSGAPVDIVRLTYRGGKATARLLPHKELVRLMRNPMLRSTRPMQGLFAEFVVVSEADADRALYEEINERLSLFNDSRSIPNCLFLNAQNKQTVSTIVAPLRRMGIPAAVIVDLDVLKDGDGWKKLLRAANVPTLQHQALSNERIQIVRQLDLADPDWKRNGGIAVLEGESNEAASNLLQVLADYGVFIVYSGELESWLSHLGATNHGPQWLMAAFEKMGENPDDEQYLNPGEGDVWGFIGRIRDWMVAHDRKGIPA